MQHTAEVQKRAACLFFILLLFHAAAAGMIFLSAGMLAALMGDPRLAEPVRWMSGPFLLIPFLAFGRGVYQSAGNTLPTAVTQVSEQAVRISVIMLVAILAMSRDNPYMAGNSAGIGAIAGGLAGLVVMILIGRRYGNPFIRVPRSFTGLYHARWKTDAKELLLSGVFVSAGAMALVLFQLADAFTVFRQLGQSGSGAAEAAVLKGIYDRGWPLVQFGAVITTVFSYAAVPVIGKAFETGQMAIVRQETGRSVKLCLVFGGAAAAGFAAVMAPLNAMLFTDAQGTVTLQLFSWTVLFGALFMTAAAMLHGAGKSLLPVLVLMGGLPLKTALNWLLVPVWGITGAAVSSVAVFALMAWLLLLLLRLKKIWQPLPAVFWLKWLASLAVMTVVVNLYLQGMDLILTDSRWHNTVKAVTASLAGAVIYMLAVRSLRIFSKEEWQLLPKIGKMMPYRSKS